MRLERSLAGSWRFQLDPNGLLNVNMIAPDRDISVPLPWQAAFHDLERYSGYAWYSKRVTLDEDWLLGELLLTFGAVDYWCQVFINGQLVGEHEGGYTPFTFPIRPYVRAGENEIAVRVYDDIQTGITIPRWPHEAPANPNLFQAAEIPHGKQDWYINVGGIWQGVTLTAVPQAYIQSARVTPDIHTGGVHVTVEFAGALDSLADSMLTLAVSGVSATAILAAGQTCCELDLTVPNPQLWTPEKPCLYTAALRLTWSNEDDSVDVRFGFREISTANGQLLLNGEPIFLLSALDQDFYPETIYTIPSEAYLRDEFEKAKALGFNSLRCHIKPPDPLYLYLADEMGLLIWAEIPSWRTFHVKPSQQPDGKDVPDVVRARARHTLEAMIRRDYNHPSLVIWTIVNEDWGTTLALSPADREWAAEMYDECKRLDPTRLVVDNSGCLNAWGPNIHVKSDLDDFHVYGNIPDHADYFEQMAEQISLRPLWTYSGSGDAQRSGQEPLILSEFGNWGLPSLQAYRDKENGEPNWFNIGAWWSAFDGMPGWPRGVFKRFQTLGLNAIWPDYEAFAAAAQWHQYQAVKFEVETLRRHAAFQGYVLTELTDVYWESNGVLDFNRCPKVFYERFPQINSEDMIIPQPERYAYWADEQVGVHLYASHYSPRPWNPAVLNWRTDGTHTEVAMPSAERGSVSDLGEHRWGLPQVNAAATIKTEFTLTTQGGYSAAKNELDVLVLPVSARSPSYTGMLVAPSRDAGLRAAIGKLGYAVEAQIRAATELVVTSHPTAEVLQWVRAGGTLLFLSSGASPFFWCQPRGGTYGGGWINNYSWLRPGIYRRLTIDNPLTLPFRAVMPKHTITGLPVEDACLQGDFLAGQISGWLQLPAVHTVQFRYGAGKVIMTTFNLEQALCQHNPDPVAVAMFHDLADYLMSDECQPQLAANY